MTFELYRDKAGEYRWRLRAKNGRIVADSGEGYIDTDDAAHGIDLVRRLAPGAELEDLTADRRETPAPAPYALGELPAELDIRWPQPPVIEREEEVTAPAGGSLSCDRAQTRYVIHTDLDRLTVTTSDVVLQVAEGTWIGRAYVEKGVERVHFDGGQYGAVELAVPADFAVSPPQWREAWLVTDVLVDGVHLDADDTALALRGRRIAILNSQVHAHRYPLWVGDTDDFWSEDIIVAGNELAADGPEATLRMVSARRSVVVENLLHNPLKHNYRVEGLSDLAFAARNTLVDAGLMLASQPGDDVGTVWFQDNVLHHRTPSLLVVDDPPGSQLRRFVASGNTIYSDAWDCFLCVTAPAGWEIGEHVIQPFQPL